MRIKSIHVINFQDFKDRSGAWVQGFSKNICGFCYHYTTRSGKLWNAILKRTNPKGSISRETKRYTDVKNKFRDYQHFAEWCQTQEGYLNKEENGNYWSLDKDLLARDGAKEYSPETCIFIPARVNTMIGPQTKRRGDTPIGVTKAKRAGAFGAKITRKEGRLSLGVFDTPLQAHFAWQRAKVDHLIYLANNLDLTPKIKQVILSKADKIEQDLELGIETIIE